MDPLLTAYFDNFITSFELKKPVNAQLDDAEKMLSLYERFINYTIFTTEDPLAFIGNNDLLDFVGPGGEGDAKIDGFAIKVSGQLVRDKEDVLRIIKANRKIDVEFIVIQTKMRPRFNTTEFLAFGLMIRKFFSDNPPKLNENLQEI